MLQGAVRGCEAWSGENTRVTQNGNELMFGCFQKRQNPVIYYKWERYKPLHFCSKPGVVPPSWGVVPVPFVMSLSAGRGVLNLGVS